jgi:hypothetical protein
VYGSWKGEEGGGGGVAGKGKGSELQVWPARVTAKSKKE